MIVRIYVLKGPKFLKYEELWPNLRNGDNFTRFIPAEEEDDHARLTSVIFSDDKNKFSEISVNSEYNVDRIFVDSEYNVNEASFCGCG